MSFRKWSICMAFFMTQVGWSLACPLCLLGLYEYHIANFSRWVMNALPIVAPMMTAALLYSKTIWHKCFHRGGCPHCHSCKHEGLS